MSFCGSGFPVCGTVWQPPGDEDRQDGFKNAVYKCSLKLPYNVHFTNKLFNDWYI